MGDFGFLIGEMYAGAAGMLACALVILVGCGVLVVDMVRDWIIDRRFR